MKKFKKIISMGMAVLMALSVMSTGVFAQNAKTETLSESYRSLLKKAGIDEKRIECMAQQIEINNLSDEQIKNYVESTIATNREAETKAKNRVVYPKNANGESVTPYGAVPNMRKNMSNAAQLQQSNQRSISTIADVVDAEDTSGLYYLVQATAGHDQMTSFVTLPIVSNAYSMDRPYHMFGISSTNGVEYTWGDIGLVYFPTSGMWKGFYNFYERNPYYNSSVEGSEIELHNEDYTFSFNGGRNVYFHLMLSTEQAILNIIEPSSWTVLTTVTYNFQTSCIPSNFAQTKFSKQITLAQLKGTNDPLNMYTGTRMTGAQYSLSHLYLAGYYDYSFTPAHCAEAKRQGPYDYSYEKVRVYNNTPWTAETVDIAFE